MTTGEASADTYLAPPSAIAEVVLSMRDGVPNVFVIGPRGAASWKSTRGLSATASLRLRPGALRAAFGLSPRELRGAAIPAVDLFGHEALDLARSSMSRAAHVLTRALGARTPSPHARLAEHALRLASRPDASPRAIAASLDVSARTLRRAIVEELGVTPRDLVRFARASRLVRRLSGRRDSLAEVALATGYADQAHMSNETRRLFGVSPTVLATRARGALIAP